MAETQAAPETTETAAAAPKESFIDKVEGELEKIGTDVENVFSFGKKLSRAYTAIKADEGPLKAKLEAFGDAWEKAEPFLVTAVNDKGLDLPVDSEAFTAVQAAIQAGVALGEEVGAVVKDVEASESAS